PGGGLPDEQLRPDLRRLPIRPRGDLLPGNTRWKAQVVLDLRTGTGLSARRVRLQHHDIEAFRRAVHGRREPRGSSPDDDQVPDLGVINRRVEAEIVGDLIIRWVQKQNLSTADDERHVVDSYLENIQQMLATGVQVGVTAT